MLACCMALYRLTEQEALRNFGRNPRSRWYGPGIDVRDPGGPFAIQQINAGVYVPHVNPHFKFSKSDSVFAIGSCFARALESYLVHHKFDVVSAAPDFDAFELAGRDSRQLGFTNKYNTAAIRDAIAWALDPSTPYPDAAIVQVADDLWIDPHTNPTLRLASRERTRERRRILNDVYSRIRNCRVVIMTLGLIEVWLDRETGNCLNMAPTPPMRARHPDRYSFHVLDYNENMKNLDDVYRLLTAYGHTDVNIVVTVSPVPLVATFTERDVVVANTLSKAMLRVCAETWAAQHSNVHYFPSYEIVTMSDRSLTWAEDGRHVQGGMVREIMSLFTNQYVA
jgi:hypothetical protein